MSKKKSVFSDEAKRKVYFATLHIVDLFSINLIFLEFAALF
jgi:hypothetical protein